MIRVFTIPEFEKSLKKLVKKFPGLKDEYADFLDKTENEGVQGISLGNGFYKARLMVKSKGKGKSGGLRIISHQTVIYHINEKHIRLTAIYDKGEISNIDREYLDNLIRKYV
jgi:hypothetical protein